MNFEFDDLEDMKEFAYVLSNKLKELGNNEISRKIKQFSYNSFTTSTEYLGEFKLLLERVKKLNILSGNEIKFEIDKAIKIIERALN
ncbi:MAG: hypothetical protein ACOCQB_00935 [Halanaerobiaceae bacterium]